MWSTAVLALTVTLHCAVYPPSAVVTVTIADPAVLAVTFPPDTDTLLLLALHVTDLLVALLGDTVAVSCADFPAFSVSVVWSSLTPVTAITVGATRRCSISYSKIS